MSVSATILAKVTFPSEQPFGIIFVLLVSGFHQVDLPRAAAEFLIPLILKGPPQVLLLLSGAGARGQPGQSALGEADF